MFVLNSGWCLTARRTSVAAAGETRTPSPPRAAASAEVDEASDQEDLPTDAEGLIETLLEREGSALSDVDRQSVESSLTYGEWGAAYDTLEAVAAAEPGAFSAWGHRLLAATRKALGRD